MYKLKFTENLYIILFMLYTIDIKYEDGIYVNMLDLEMMSLLNLGFLLYINSLFPSFNTLVNFQLKYLYI